MDCFGAALLAMLCRFIGVMVFGTRESRGNPSKYRIMRRFIVTLSAFAAVILSSAISAAPAPVSARPNIVLIVADDHGLDALGCYGNPVIQDAAPRCTCRGRHPIHLGFLHHGQLQSVALGHLERATQSPERDVWLAA
jgi:hypothetical protein